MSETRCTRPTVNTKGESCCTLLKSDCEETQEQWRPEATPVITRYKASMLERRLCLAHSSSPRHIPKLHHLHPANQPHPHQLSWAALHSPQLPSPPVQLSTLICHPVHTNVFWTSDEQHLWATHEASPLQLMKRRPDTSPAVGVNNLWSHDEEAERSSPSLGAGDTKPVTDRGSSCSNTRTVIMLLS